MERLEQLITDRTEPWTDDDLQRILQTLTFNDDAIVNNGIEQELIAILSMREGDIVEAKAAPRTKRCKNARSHSARHRHGLCKAEKWIDCPDNPDKTQREKEEKKKSLYKWPRSKNIKSKSGTSVEVGTVLGDHFRSNDKDRSLRITDLPHAITTIREGSPSTRKVRGENRLHFTHPFTEDGKVYDMNVVCVKKRGKWHALTYHRYSK